MPRLPDALMDPAAFPHRPTSVELRETHISWVFLAGNRVYKVKKPVRFAFLDYGTVARRRALCAEELRLGRRFAPSVYVGLVAIVPRGPDGLQIAQECDPRASEYAVEMRRYAEADTLRAQLDDGSASAPDLVAAGRAIAGFHAAAPRDGGAPLADVVEETLSSLAAAGAPAARLGGLSRFCRAALAGCASELADRDARGLVRDGHGDLRAEHLLLGPRIEAVDALEFDRTLRVADVAYDLSFLAMDVARRDDDLAAALLRGYRAAGGDPGSDGLFDFLCALRALVRVKVDLLRAGQLSGAAADERRARAMDQLALAERFAWRVRLPAVVCVTGLAASGKSTVAEALAVAAGRPVLASDRIRKLRAGIDPLQHAAPEAYGDAQSRTVYAELAHRAAEAVRRDGGAIVDATFRRPADAAAFAGGARAAGRAAWIVCEAPPAVLHERARRRAARRDSVSDAGPEIVAAELSRYPGRFRAPAEPLARLETTRPVAVLLEDLAERLDARLQQIAGSSAADPGWAAAMTSTPPLIPSPRATRRSSPAGRSTTAAISESSSTGPAGMPPAWASCARPSSP